jgi:sec-independent protein translocase protein TatA
MNTILLFGMPGGAELFFIVLIIIMLFGSKKIPELARGLGKGIREIKNATGEIQREITEGTRELNSLKDKVNVEKQVKDLMKGNNEKKQEVREEKKESDSTSETNKQETINQEQVSSNEQPISQTVQRRSPYSDQEHQSNSEEIN